MNRNDRFHRRNIQEGCANAHQKLMRTQRDHATEVRPDTMPELVGRVTSPEASQLLAITHEQRLERLQQLAVDLTRALDLAEEQRRILRDLTKNANELVDSAPRMERATPRRASSRKR
jgi:hypothetical protein